MSTYKHKFTRGISITLINPTKKGFKCEQTELYQAWGDKKLRTPKVKTVYYTNSELAELFEISK